MQTRNACGLFQKRTACLRLGLNEFTDTALPDHGRRARARGLVRKQQLHVLGAGVLAIDAVDRSRFALDTARDLQFIGIVEACRGAAVLIVEKKRHFSRIARWARAGTGENDVIHAGCAHVLVGVFAHNPAQGFDQIGLAATIGADNTCQPAFNDKFGGLDKGFETEKAEFCEAHQTALPQNAIGTDAVRRPPDFNRQLSE